MKYLIVTLTCLAAFALGACGNDKEEAPTPASDVVETSEVQESDAVNADATADVPVDAKSDSTSADAAE